MLTSSVNTTTSASITVNRCLSCLEANVDSYPCPHCGWSPTAKTKSRLLLKPGTILHGRYVIAKTLSYGEFSSVYLGWDSKEEKKLAIKEFLPIGLVDRDQSSTNLKPIPEDTRTYYNGLNKFLDGGLTLSKFRNNPNLASVYSLIKANETGYAVMEYVEGINLGSYIKAKGTLNWQQTLALFSRVMGTVDLLHAQGVLHGAINPSCIILCKNNQIKLFGFATARHALGKNIRRNVEGNKSGFTADEQYIANHHEGPWTDVYAIAASMYFCLTGNPPPDSLRVQGSDPLTNSPSLNVEIPKLAELALLQGLAANAKLRPKTVGEFHSGLIKNTHLSEIIEKPPIASPNSILEQEMTPDTETRNTAPQQSVSTNDTEIQEHHDVEQVYPTDESSSTIKLLCGLLFVCFATASIIVTRNMIQTKSQLTGSSDQSVKPSKSIAQSEAKLFKHAMLLKQQGQENLAMPLFTQLAESGNGDAKAIIDNMSTVKVAANRQTLELATTNNNLQDHAQSYSKPILMDKNQSQPIADVKIIEPSKASFAKVDNSYKVQPPAIFPVITINPKQVKDNDFANDNIKTIFSIDQTEEQSTHESNFSALFSQAPQQKNQNEDLNVEIKYSPNMLAEFSQTRLGIPNIQSLLGAMYDRGQGVGKDYYQALYWYQKAADQGEPSAITYLENLHRRSKIY